MPTNKYTDVLGLAIAQETFKVRNPGQVSLEEYKTLKVGTKIRSHYRSATMEGTIVSIVKKGSSSASTIYEIRPSRASKHPGEPETVHRHGDKITVIKEFTKKTKPSSESFIDSIGLTIAIESRKDHPSLPVSVSNQSVTFSTESVSTEGFFTNSIIKMKDHFSKEKYKNYEAHFVRNVEQLKTVRSRLEKLKTIKPGDLPDVKVTENASKFLTGMYGVPKDAVTITKTMTRQLELTKIINSSFIEALKKSIATTVDGLKLYLSNKEKGAALIYKGMELSVTPELKKYLTVKNYKGEFPLASEPFVRQFRLTTNIWKGVNQEKINAIGFYHPAFKDFDTISKIKPLSLEESKKLLDLAGAVNKATETISLRSTFKSLDDVFYSKVREAQTELKKYENDDGSYDRSIDGVYAFIDSFYKEMKDFLFVFSNMNYISCSALMNIINTNLNRYK